MDKGQISHFSCMSPNHPHFAFLVNQHSNVQECVSTLGLLWSVLVRTPHRFTNRICAVSLSTKQSESFLVLLEMLRVLAPLHAHVHIGTICFHRKQCLYMDWDCMESSDHEADRCRWVLLFPFLSVVGCVPLALVHLHWNVFLLKLLIVL